MGITYGNTTTGQNHGNRFLRLTLILIVYLFSNLPHTNFSDGYLNDDLRLKWKAEGDPIAIYKDIAMAQFKLMKINHGNKTMGANHGNKITFGKTVSSSPTPIFS